MLAEFGPPVVCGWGVHGAHRGQDQVVLSWLRELGIKPLVLGVTKDGHPSHPLYVPNRAKLVAFTGWNWSPRHKVG
jgi:hypothetical protein